MDQEKGLPSRKLQKAVNEGSNHRMFILSRSAESLKKELYTHIKKKKKIILIFVAQCSGGILNQAD